MVDCGKSLKGVLVSKRTLLCVVLVSVVVMGALYVNNRSTSSASSTSYTRTHQFRPHVQHGDVSATETEWSIDSSCVKPSGGFQSWNQGVVSVLKPTIQTNCSLLFLGDQNEEKRIKTANAKHKAEIYVHPDKYGKDAHNCSYWKRQFHEKMFYISQEEKEFSLAFVFVVYQNPQQFLRLLQTLYRPHNVYCIHVDQKANFLTKSVVKNLARCVPNIIIPHKIESVVRGHISVVNAQLNCVRDLHSIRNKYRWQYVVTLCGKELPLRTNREMVRVFKSLNGTSAVEAKPLPKDHIRRRFKYKAVLLEQAAKNVRSKDLLGPIPFNLTPYKSLAYYGLSLEFVEFLLNNSTAHALYEYMKDISTPEEHYIATLFMIPGVPGGFRIEQKDSIPKITSVIWLYGQKRRNWSKLCHGSVVHAICIVSSGDLQRLKKFLMIPNSNKPSAVRGPLLHNKYFMEQDRTIVDCVEEEIVSRNRLEYVRDHCS